ncbi:MAG: hypothetical protein CMQ43_01435 [Gammaproteobacteria bacterium]|nr:hypothetical protein [Gammaproteobacteria bacterium]|tara:strand:+ start:16287 stop:17021 length:735 start_codon:yes stop_codon:yes gene_type:complete
MSTVDSHLISKGASESATDHQQAAGVRRSTIDCQRGWLIAACGIDGSGKSTHITLLNELAESLGISTKVCKLLTSDSNYFKTLQDIGDQISSDSYCNLLIFERLRRAKAILPRFRSHYGLTILDRYILCDLAYVEAYGASSELIQVAHSVAPVPDLTIVFDVPPHEAMRRIRARGKPVYERQENERVLKRARRAYLNAAPSWNATIIDTNRPLTESWSQLAEIFVDLISDTSPANTERAQQCPR